MPQVPISNKPPCKTPASFHETLSPNPSYSKSLADLQHFTQPVNLMSYKGILKEAIFTKLKFRHSFVLFYC